VKGFSSQLSEFYAASNESLYLLC